MRLTAMQGGVVTVVPLAATAIIRCRKAVTLIQVRCVVPNTVVITNVSGGEQADSAIRSN